MAQARRSGAKCTQSSHVKRKAKSRASSFNVGSMGVCTDRSLEGLRRLPALEEEIEIARDRAGQRGLGSSIHPHLSKLPRRDLKALREGIEVMRRLMAADRLPQ